MIVRRVVGAMSVDGAGGDEGQDLRLDSADGLTIFEVKSFARRLTGRQRRQVRDSLSQAVAHHQAMRRWVLVMPLNPSPAEIRWLEQDLPGAAPGVILEWWGRDWLDGHVMERDIAYLEGANYTLLERARQFKLEQEACLTGEQLLERYGQLAALGEEISPYWAWSSLHSARGDVHVLRATQPDSALVDPVTITPHFVFPAGDDAGAATLDALVAALRTGGDVHVPGRYIDHVSIETASEATERLLRTGQDESITSMRIVTEPDTEGLPAVMTLARSDPGGATVAQTTVVFTHRQRGTHGQTLTGTDTCQALTIRVVTEVDHEPDHPAGEGVIAAVGPSANLTLDPSPSAGRLPSEVWKTLAVVNGQVGDRLLLRDEDGNEIVIDGAFDGQSAISWFVQLVTALDVLGQYLKRPLPIPTKISRDDLRQVLAVGQALTGQSVRLAQRSFTATIRAGMLGHFLAALGDSAAGGAIYVDAGSQPVTINGQTHMVDGLAYWAPKIELANRDQLARKSDIGIPHQAEFTVLNDGGIYLTRAVSDPGSEWSAVPR